MGMSFDSDSNARLQQMHVSVRESKGGAINTPIPTTMIRERLVHMLAGLLTGDCVKVIEEEYSTEYRLDVYVLTADQLERLVRRRAERMHPAMPSVYEVSSNLHPAT
jgi:hypothetical protein